MSSFDFEQEVVSDGSECLYFFRFGWRVRGGLNPVEHVSTPLAITTSRICWEGVAIRERRGWLTTKKEEERVFRSYDVADVARAEVGKGPYWPERPSYDLEVHSDDRFEIFFIESLEAVSFMREVAEVFQRVGIQVVDRHDIFWAGGSDPYYRPPA